MTNSDSTAIPRADFSRTLSRLLSKREIAEHLGVSTRTIANWRAARRIDYIKVSPRVVRFDVQQVTESLARREVKAVRELNGLRRRQREAVTDC